MGKPRAFIINNKKELLQFKNNINFFKLSCDFLDIFNNGSGILNNLNMYIGEQYIIYEKPFDLKSKLFLENSNVGIYNYFDIITRTISLDVLLNNNFDIIYDLNDYIRLKKLEKLYEK